MLGLRDLVFIAPTPSSLHLHHQHQQAQGQGQTISSSDNHHCNLPLPTSSAALSVGLGIFPLLTATTCIPQQHHPNNNNNNIVHDRGGGGGGELEGCNNTGDCHNYWNLKMCPEVQVVEFDSSSCASASARKGVIHHHHHHHHMEQNEDNNNNNNNNSNSIYGADMRVCQDCGNRAKKDCGYKRCRTCCKGRGYDCTTHVKSTWVPTKRRMRLRAQNDAANHTSTSNATTTTTTTTKSFDSSSCHQIVLMSDAGFKQSLPGQVSAPAVFKCHRVSAIGNGEYEFVYLATVHISGHVFKGFLYDQGAVVDGKYELPCVSELQLLGNNCSGKNTNNNNNGECSSAIGVPTPTSAYPASAC